MTTTSNLSFLHLSLQQTIIFIIGSSDIIFPINRLIILPLKSHKIVKKKKRKKKAHDSFQEPKLTLHWNVLFCWPTLKTPKKFNIIENEENQQITNCRLISCWSIHLLTTPLTSIYVLCIDTCLQQLDYVLKLF